MDSGSKNMKFRIDDIACTGCVEDMEKILRDREGILAASVNFSDAMVSVSYDPEVMDRKQVFMAVRKLGYKLELVSET